MGGKGWHRPPSTQETVKALQQPTTGHAPARRSSGHQWQRAHGDAPVSHILRVPHPAEEPLSVTSGFSTRHGLVFLGDPAALMCLPLRARLFVARAPRARR